MSDAKDSELPPAPGSATPVDLSADASPRRAGCLKWGLVGCAAASALLIVGLLILGAKAKSLLGWALESLGTQIEAACTAEVSAEEKARFREALKRFTEEVKARPERVEEFRKKATSATIDGKVTPEELSELTRALAAGTNAPAPAAPVPSP